MWYLRCSSSMVFVQVVVGLVSGSGRLDEKLVLVLLLSSCLYVEKSGLL